MYFSTCFLLSFFLSTRWSLALGSNGEVVHSTAQTRHATKSVVHKCLHHLDLEKFYMHRYNNFHIDKNMKSRLDELTGIRHHRLLEVTTHYTKRATNCHSRRWNTITVAGSTGFSFRVSAFVPDPFSSVLFWHVLSLHGPHHPSSFLQDAVLWIPVWLHSWE